MHIHQIPVDGDGVTDLDGLRSSLAAEGDRTLVSIMLANNETGVIQPIAEIAEIAHTAGALVHADAIQAVGRVPVDVKALGVDVLTISAHKIWRPRWAPAQS